MKRSWLRGMLLGVSLALLLAGGVALAQMTLTVDKECLECWNGTPGPGVDPPKAFFAKFAVSGLDEEYLTCARLLFENKVMADLMCGPAPAGGAGQAYITASCPQYLDMVLLFLDDTQHAPEVDVDLAFGKWTFEVWQIADEGGAVVSSPDKVSLRIAQVCEAEVAEEFVPEPGTIALLGSGLAGLAGYATLPWRNRK